MKTALIVASALPDPDKEKIGKLFRQYHDMAYPPSGKKSVKVDEAIANKMKPENWERMTSDLQDALKKLKMIL